MDAPKKPILLPVIRPDEVQGRVMLEPASVSALAVLGTSDDAPLACGTCGTLLTKGMPRSELHDFVIKCAGCGAFNLA